MNRKLHLSKIEQDKIIAFDYVDYNGAEIAWKTGRSKGVLNYFLISPGTYGTKQRRQRPKVIFFKTRETNLEFSLQVNYAFPANRRWDAVACVNWIIRNSLYIIKILLFCTRNSKEKPQFLSVTLIPI